MLGALMKLEGLASPLPRAVLYLLVMLVGLMIGWACIAQLDIVAVAQGKIVPQGFLKIVQPPEQGIVRDILVKDGDTVQAGEVLVRMDTSLSAADRNIVANELRLKELQLRRIEAELDGKPLKRGAQDPDALFAEVLLQQKAHQDAYKDALDGEKALLAKAQHDLKVALEIETKLQKTLPLYREQAQGWQRLANEGFAGKLMAMERQRLYVESEQDLRAQSHSVESLRASIAQSAKHIAQITSNYRQQLYNERLEAVAQRDRLRQELDKHEHRLGLLELRAPRAGTVKDIATHTPGTVVAPGTILLTLVPLGEPLLAEVWISNADAGFVNYRQKARLKFSAYPFQKYGMLDGVVTHISADAQDRSSSANSAAPSLNPAAY
ncbi:MAG TPA: HlyD family type I secretion periplasmic adaptor subunit, partial [Nitrospira sp.]|nr:HlyD family type I secretion periplasmic adaptor subunit [Nitrospira sp.]